jgi:hypothetical protein
MSHCVAIAMIFVSAIFSRVRHLLSPLTFTLIFARATLTLTKMALTAKMRELHLLPKWRPTKNRGHNFG